MTTDHTADGALSPELKRSPPPPTTACTRRPAKTYPDQEASAESPRPPAPRSPPARASARSPTPNGRASSAPAKNSARPATAGNPRRQAQARRRHRVRAGRHPRRPARTLPPRDRQRRRGLARHHPRDPHPRHHDHDNGRSRAAIADGERARSPHSRRASATAAGTPARGLAPGAPSARRSSAHPGSRARQPLGQVIAIRPSARQVDDAPAHAGRLQVSRDPRGRLSPGAVAVEHDRHTPTGEQPRPLRAPRRRRPAPRSPAARASGR